ncbi:MAG: hypothetical protein CR978_02220 [Gammaproteobacteria bacterium]|nr:MAG: hypothetical protein CR978_02220 [Gammaproteobacteria bacterium]PIE38811.1 MAG: hypothetical protein CSA53_03730 [Gammaproteobacteria bacterium]
MSSARASVFFWRVYLALALLVLVVGMVLEFFLESRAQHQQWQREQQLIRGSFVLAEQLWQAAPGDAFLDNIQTQTDIPAQLLLLDDFLTMTDVHQRLSAGEVVVLFDSGDNPVFYRRLGGSDRVLALIPAPINENALVLWVVPLFYFTIGLIVFFWLRPLARDLDHLQQSAQRFGAQDFSSRVAMASGSWLAPVGQAFNAMAQRIQWLLRSHQELTHAVSHELRTPLARMHFALEMMSSAKTQLDRDRHHAAMLEDIDELNTLIDEMLGYASLSEENLTPRMESLPIRPWLDAYVAKRSALGYRCELGCDVAADVGNVLVDERLLTRALDNLVGNAERYAHRRVCVRVALGDKGCRLCVDDDGPGIAVEHRSLALSAFARLGADERGGHSGFGLGLAIVNRIAQLHKGRVMIAKSPEGGARVCLFWPV